MLCVRDSWLLGLGLFCLLVLYGFWLAYGESRARPETLRMTRQDLLYAFLTLLVIGAAVSVHDGHWL